MCGGGKEGAGGGVGEGKSRQLGAFPVCSPTSSSYLFAGCN